LKITPGGGASRSFGKEGRATIHPGETSGGIFDALAVDDLGRPLVGGSFGVGLGRKMVLARTSSRGRQEVDFGPRGVVATPGGGLGDPGALFFDPQGRLIFVHSETAVPNVPDGLVAARYLLTGR
jgi:hypothetical protein